jgi:cytochrome c5
MASTARILVAASLVVWSTALALSATVAPGSSPQKTTNDGIYTKEQADGAKAKFDKICADCHAFTVAAKKKEKDVPLGDEPFTKNWDGRTLGEMVTTIALTMPNDGSAVVTEDEAVDLVAYVLQQNGFPAGSTPLTKTSASDIVLRAKQ